MGAYQADAPAQCMKGSYQANLEDTGEAQHSVMERKFSYTMDPISSLHAALVLDVLMHIRQRLGESSTGKRFEVPISSCSQLESDFLSQALPSPLLGPALAQIGLKLSLTDGKAIFISKIMGGGLEEEEAEAILTSLCEAAFTAAPPADGTHSAMLSRSMAETTKIVIDSILQFCGEALAGVDADLAATVSSLDIVVQPIVPRYTVNQMMRVLAVRANA